MEGNSSELPEFHRNWLCGKHG